MGEGVDHPQINPVYKIGLSPSIFKSAQGFGCAARHPMNDGEFEDYYNLYCIEDFAYLYERIYKTKRNSVQKRKEWERNAESIIPSVSPQEF